MARVSGSVTQEPENAFSMRPSPRMTLPGVRLVAQSLGVSHSLSSNRWSVVAATAFQRSGKYSGPRSRVAHS